MLKAIEFRTPIIVGPVGPNSICTIPQKSLRNHLDPQEHERHECPRHPAVHEQALVKVPKLKVTKALPCRE